MIAKTITTQLAAVSLALLVIAGCASQRGRSPDPPSVTGMTEVAASPSVFADIRVVRRLNGLGAVTDAAWERPGDPRSDLLVLTRRGAVVLKGSDLSEVRRIEWEFRKEIAGVGTTWQIVRFKDGPRAVSMPGIGASMFACADPATGQLLWTRDVPGGTVLSAALRGPDGRIRFAVAGQYADTITWLDEGGKEVGESRQDVGFANEFGQYLITDLNQDGADELYHASYTRGPLLDMVLRDAAGNVMCKQEVAPRGRWLQSIQLGSDFVTSASVVMLQVTVLKGLLGMETKWLAAHPDMRSDRRNFRFQEVSRDVYDAMAHRGTATPCSISGREEAVYLRGNGNEMSADFLLRLHDQDGRKLLRTVIRNETLQRHDLFAKGQMVGRSPVAGTQASVLVCFADTIYEVAFKESDPVP